MGVKTVILDHLYTPAICCWFLCHCCHRDSGKQRKGMSVIKQTVSPVCVENLKATNKAELETLKRNASEPELQQTTVPVVCVPARCVRILCIYVFYEQA